MAETTLSLEFVNFSDRIVAGADSSGIFDEFLKKMQSGVDPVEQMSPDCSRYLKRSTSSIGVTTLMQFYDSRPPVL